MEAKSINPWHWQEAYGFSQAIELKGADRIVVCAGQVSVDENGEPVHAGNMEGQVSQAMDNLETVLGAAGLKFSNVVRLNIYTTDVPAFLESHPKLRARLGGATPSSTLLGVAALFHPDILVEIEATAAV